MLFRGKIEPACAYCKHSGKIDNDTYLCAKKGIVAANNECRKFKYDPLKRVPIRMKPKDFSQCDEMDFSL